MKKTIRKTMARAAMVLLYVAAAVICTGGCGAGSYNSVAFRALADGAGERVPGGEGASIEAEAGTEGKTGAKEPDPSGESVSQSGVSAEEEEAKAPVPGDRSLGAPDADEAGDVVVYVCGAVERPGVYSFPGGGRVCEAVAAAGGLSKDAEPASVNQAAFLTDGQQITVLTVKEASSLSKAEMCALAGDGAGGGTGAPDRADAPVNINTADSEELMTLKGIGEAKAAAIIEWRDTNGAFSSSEEIMKVSGIGEGLYAGIKDRITVGSG